MNQVSEGIFGILLLWAATTKWLQQEVRLTTKWLPSESGPIKRCQGVRLCLTLIVTLQLRQMLCIARRVFKRKYFLAHTFGHAAKILCAAAAQATSKKSAEPNRSPVANQKLAGQKLISTFPLSKNIWHAHKR